LREKITIRIDPEIDSILNRHLRSGETTTACIKRMLKSADTFLGDIHSLKTDQIESNQETKRMLSLFLEQVKKPFSEINGHLESINNQLEDR